MAEIRRTQAALEGCGALVLPLHGDLPPAEQDRALRPAEGRRVVLATSIAETSLTVPGVRIVVDGGWRRAPRLDPATGLTRLTTLRISRAAAEQRAGRAGREAPGVAIRLWSTALHRGLAAHDRPEILEAELSGLALGLRRLGRGAWRSAVPRPAAAGRAGRRNRAAGRAWRARRGGPHHRRRAADGRAGRASAAGGDDAGGARRQARPRWPPISPRCWRNATRCAARMRRRISACGWRRSPTAIPPPTAAHCRASAASPASIAGGCACLGRAGRRRSGAAARGRLSRTASPSAAASPAASGWRAAAGHGCRAPIRWRARRCWRSPRWN